MTTAVQAVEEIMEAAPVAQGNWKLSASTPLGQRGEDMTVNLAVEVTHKREHKLYRATIGWIVTTACGGTAYSWMFAKDIHLFDEPAARFSRKTMERLFERAKDEALQLAVRDSAAFKDLLNVDYDALTERAESNG